ncbi:hypothetical protein BKA65DRAFT_474223 [Rhexocercosporidium sp. MPI-PUGE-AT-0058]|nr:hypothetical protein BKA65DRAFT_474223 [Rhexocercosporidium sp. MPI-PUGE-AT-0058]
MSSKEAMEVFRSAVDAANALNAVSELIPMAIEQNSNLKAELQSYRVEINSSKQVVDLIRSERGLQTSGVVAGIRMLQSHGDILKEDLMCMDDKEGDDLKKMLDIFRTKKKTVVQQIRLASVGLTKSDGAVTVQTKLVESTNKAVKKALGQDSGLLIASFLAKLNHIPDENGRIYLSESEYEKLTWQQIQTSHPEAKTVTTRERSRILCNCLARGQSIQILGPVAEDLWAGIAFIKIEGLVAMDQAIQFGYPVTLEVFREGLDRQEKRIASSRVRELKA